MDLSPAVRTWMSFQMGIGGILGGIVALIMAAFINSAVNTPNCTTNTFGQQTCTSVSSFNPSGFIALIGVVFIIFGIVVLYYTRE